MLWRTHLRICNWICEDLGLPPGPSTIIKDSVIVPDKWKDYPHHHGKGRTIQKFILEARKAFLNNDYQNTYYHLGIAFHYIQDAYTSFVWRSRNTQKRQAWHNKYEQWIQNSGYTEDLGYLIANTFKNDPGQKQYWMSILNYGSQPIEGKEATLQLATLNQGKQSQWDSRWGNPRVDLNLAYFVSLKVAESILSVKTNPTLQWQLARNLETYQNTLVERETEFVNELIETVNKRDRAKTSTGILGFISRSIIGGYHNWQTNSKFQQYQGNEHFRNILKLYDSSIDQITRPHRDWYNITTPQLKINQVPKQLIISTQATPGSYTIGNSFVQRAC